MKIGVIGAGVVGTSAALALAGRGHDVTLFDREGVAAGASRGNAGAFAFTEIIPLATPGIMRKAPLWLFDPGGPLSIPPAYALRIAPWLAAFWRASLPDRYRAAVAAQTALMAHSSAALERLVAAHGLEGLLRREGQLQLYEGEGEYRASLPQWQERRAAGIRFELLQGPAAIAEIQPGLSPRFTHAGYTPDWLNVVDPLLWVEKLAEIFAGQGGRIERADIRQLAASASEVRVADGAGEWSFDRVVVAACTCRSRPSAATTPRFPRAPSTCAPMSASPATASSSAASARASASAAASSSAGWNFPRAWRAPRRCSRRPRPSCRA